MKPVTVGVGDAEVVVGETLGVGTAVVADVVGDDAVGLGVGLGEGLLEDADGLGPDVQPAASSRATPAPAATAAVRVVRTRPGTVRVCSPGGGDAVRAVPRGAAARFGG